MTKSKTNKTISVSMSLPQLVATIKALIVKADQAGDKYEQFATAAGKHLADAKLRLQAKNKSIRSQKKAERTEQPQTWEDFVKEHFNFNQQRADLYIAISDGRKSVTKLRAEKTEQKRVEGKRKVTATSRSKSTSEAPPVQPHMPPKEYGTFLALRELAHEVGCKLQRHGKQYDLTIDGKTDRYVNLDLVRHMLVNIRGGKVPTTVGDECMGNPLSMRVEMNPESAKAYAAARMPMLVIELKKMAAMPAEYFVDYAVEPSDLETAADFLRQIATKIRGRTTTQEVETVH